MTSTLPPAAAMRSLADALKRWAETDSFFVSSPSPSTFSSSNRFFRMPVSCSVWGVIVGGVVLGWLNIEGLAVIGSKFNDVSGLNIEVPKYQFGIYGIIIVLMMLFRPQGLIPERRRKRELEEGVHDRALYEERVADEPGVGERA